MTSSTNLRKWALGKEFKADPWQGFTSPQFQDMLAKMGDDGEKECTYAYTAARASARVLASFERASFPPRFDLCFDSMFSLFAPPLIAHPLTHPSTDAPTHPPTGGRTDVEKYSDQAWVLRYRKERDAALKAHRRQYRRRQILSKLGLARAPISNEYERFMDVDREKEWDQEERRGWVKRRSRPPSPVVKSKLAGKGGKKAANRR